MAGTWYFAASAVISGTWFIVSGSGKRITACASRRACLNARSNAPASRTSSKWSFTLWRDEIAFRFLTILPIRGLSDLRPRQQKRAVELLPATVAATFRSNPRSSQETARSGYHQDGLGLSSGECEVDPPSPRRLLELSWLHS